MLKDRAKHIVIVIIFFLKQIILLENVALLNYWKLYKMSFLLFNEIENSLLLHNGNFDLISNYNSTHHNVLISVFYHSEIIIIITDVKKKT